MKISQLLTASKPAYQTLLRTNHGRSSLNFSHVKIILLKKLG